MRRFNSLSAVSALVCALLAASAADEALEAQIANLNMPPGFEISIFAEVPGARSPAGDPASGAIAVGTWSGMVYGVWDRDDDGAADAVATLLEGLKVPNGVAFHGGRLYVAKQHRIARYPAAGLAPTRRRRPRAGGARQTALRGRGPCRPIPSLCRLPWAQWGRAMRRRHSRRFEVSTRNTR